MIELRPPFHSDARIWGCREAIMALIDVVKFDGDPNLLAWKFPSENLRLGTQLVVKTAQVAFFVREGKILDKFTEGTYTLKSNNIPLLGKLISLPFGGDTPFQAEVWFVNLLTKLDAPWGAPAPLQVEDPKYGVIVPLRAFGQFGYRVKDPEPFLQRLVGVQGEVTNERIEALFKGILLQSMASNVVKALVKEGIGVLQLSAFLHEISRFCLEQSSTDFENVGIELLNFYFISLSIPENDPSYIRLKEIKEKSAELAVIGRDIYQFDKSMDVLKTAAGNQGESGSLMQAGLGLGMGLNVGNQIGQQFGGMVTQISGSAPAAPPPLPSRSIQVYVALDGAQAGPFTVPVLKQMAASGAFTPASLVWKEGMSTWMPASALGELQECFSPSVPPPIPR
jgi:membrane protease subunit (stomatin/prohibitin family)